MVFRESNFHFLLWPVKTDAEDDTGQVTKRLSKSNVQTQTEISNAARTHKRIGENPEFPMETQGTQVSSRHSVKSCISGIRGIS